MKRRILSFIAGLALAAAPLSACAVSAPETPAVEAVVNEMQYITKEDLKTAVESESGDYILLDLRRAADYETAHITGSLSADVDSAVQEGKDNEGTANLKAAILEATGEELGTADSKYVLICYSGKAFAQKATDLLIGLEFNAENLYTLEGGNNGWAEAGEAFTGLME